MILAVCLSDVKTERAVFSKLDGEVVTMGHVSVDKSDEIQRLESPREHLKQTRGFCKMGGCQK